jgi:short-subunit dehydrogenase
MWAVVIGSGPGLGRSLALSLAGHGLGVALMARRADSLDALSGEVAALGGPVSTHVVDAADPEAVRRAVSGVSQQGRITVLAYNAMRSAGGLAEAATAALREASDVNLHSPVAAVQAALDDLALTSGTVMLTGGGLALQPVGSLGVLSAGKAALRAAAFALADELAPRGVKVRTVTVAGRIEPGGSLDPDRIAEVFWQGHLDPSAPVETVLSP